VIRTRLKIRLEHGWRAASTTVEKGRGRKPAPPLDHLLSPALSSTFGGGEGDKTARWEHLGKDDFKMRPARQHAGAAFFNFEPGELIW
jgi:hypothetical protein